MPAKTYLTPSTVNLHNVLALAILCIFAVFSSIVTVTNETSIAAEHDLGVVSFAHIPASTLANVLVQLGFFGLCALLARNETSGISSVRYGVKLQVQAAIELLSLFSFGALGAVFVYYLAGLFGDAATQTSMRDAIASDGSAPGPILLTLVIPGATVIIASLRLHILSRRPGALTGMIDGNLSTRTVAVRGDATAARSELVRYLEPLTSPEMPNLGRVMYGSHPKLTTYKKGDHSVHELVWWTCPMKLRIVLVSLENGMLELRIQCLLRNGWYRTLLFPTPADVVAEMQYIDVHLVRPFVAELEQASVQRQHDALKAQAVEAQLRILQAQIEPHFLFNTLANVRQLYRMSHDSGETMLDHLITYLRCAMEDLRAEYTSVVKEIDLAMHYLAIMRIRMGERLAYCCSMPDTLVDHPMPPAMLISLVENAIKHGLAGTSRGEIVLSATSDGTSLRVSVTDNGAGISSVGGTGIGLSNIRQRLEAIYGARAWLEVGSPIEGGFNATIVIPLEKRK